jgi:hypothetical protein
MTGARASRRTRDSEGAVRERAVNAEFQDTHLAGEVHQLQSAAFESAWHAAHGSTWTSVALLKHLRAQVTGAVERAFLRVMRLCDRSLPMLRPDGRVHQGWSLLLLLLIVYTAIVPPLVVAFPDELDPRGLQENEGDQSFVIAIFALNLTVDVVFLLDLIVNFRTA